MPDPHRLRSGHIADTDLRKGAVEQHGFRDGEYYHIIRMLLTRPVPPEPAMYRVEHRVIHHGAKLRGSSHAELFYSVKEARDRFDQIKTNPPTYYENEGMEP